MQDLFEIEPSKLRQTIRLLSIELQARNWRAYTLHAKSPIVSIVRDDGKSLFIYGSTPPTTSFVAASIASNKLATSMLLADVENIRQLDMVRFVPGEDQNEFIADFIDKNRRIVVKPIDGAHGNGVTTNITDLSGALTAIEEARGVANGSSILIQAQYEAQQPHELRILCIDDRYIGAIYRQPARIKGDGVSTIRMLIEQENQQENRGAPYVQLLAAIDIPRSEKYLGELIDSVPEKDIWINVLGVANYGSGGETIDVTEEIPQWLIDDALAVARRLELPLAGVDFIMKGYPNLNSSRDELDAVVLEVNRSPSLGIHQEPTGGKPRDSVRAFVDYLARL